MGALDQLRAHPQPQGDQKSVALSRNADAELVFGSKRLHVETHAAIPETRLGGSEFLDLTVMRSGQQGGTLFV